MKCPDSADWIALDSTSNREIAYEEELRQHLRECPSCRREQEEARLQHRELIQLYDSRTRGWDQEDVLENLLSRLPNRLPRKASGKRRRWALMTSLAAGVGLILLLAQTPSETSRLLAQAQETLRAVRTMQCRVSSQQLPSPAPSQPVPSLDSASRESLLSMSTEYGGRQDHYVDGELRETTLLDREGWGTFINHRRKTFVQQINPGTGEKNFFDSEHDPTVFLQILRSLLGEMKRKLGPQRIEGRRTHGFEAPRALLSRFRRENLPNEFTRRMEALRKLGNQGSDSNESSPSSSPSASDGFVRLWIDSETSLPTRFEEHFVKRDGSVSVWIKDRFLWNVPLDPGTFSPPSDYDGTFEEIVPSPKGSEEDLIAMLEAYAEISEGSYPFPFLNVGGQAGRQLLEKRGVRLRGMTPDDRRAFDETKLGRTWREFNSRSRDAFSFLYRLFDEDRDPTYYGEHVTQLDSDRVLFSWPLENGETRIVYGDLRAETKSPGD